MESLMRYQHAHFRLKIKKQKACYYEKANLLQHGGGPNGLSSHCTCVTETFLMH